MNRICFIIMIHKNKEQALMLIERLKRDFDLYIHIDKKSSIDIVSNDENVHIYKKFKVIHGGVSQVTTTLFMLREAYKNNYERYIFISGQDLPLKNNEYIINFFDNNKDKEFITYQDVRSNEAIFKNLSARINNYNFGTFYRKVTHIKLRTMISKLPIIKRELPKDIYFGDSWFNLTNIAVNYILDYVEKNKIFLDRMNYTWGCDEIFFQSILMRGELKSRCVNNSLRYLIWQGGVPITFTLKDYNELIKKDVLFARKFDEKVDNEIILKLYNYTNRT